MDKDNNLKVHKIKLIPNNKQKTYFAKACGVSRFAYNWALARWQKQYKQDLHPNEAKLRRELNAIKSKEFPWMLEVTKNAPQQSIKNLGLAFNRFFKKHSNYPKFKKKFINDSFRADNGPPAMGLDAVTINNKYIKLAKIGWVKMTEKLRFEGQIKSVVISRKAGSWYAAISVDTSQLPHIRKNHGVVGIDLGISALATLSTGEKYIGSKSLTNSLKKLRKLNRRLSRTKKSSQNRIKAKQKLARLHEKIYNLRIDYMHKLTTDIILNNKIIVIEDLNVKGMLANRRLSRALSEQSFYEFRRQLEYKSKYYNSQVIVADRFYPSSKICNICGHKNTSLSLRERNWQCICGQKHDRDLNAAINLKKIADDTVSCTGINACGVESSG